MAGAAVVLLALTSCSISQEDPNYVPPAPLPALEQLAQAPLADPEPYSAGEGLLSFVTEDRNIVCSLTSVRGEHVNLPYEPNNYADSANNKLAIVPAAHCELARYPKPESADVTSDCAGTNMGYLGGTAIALPDSARYGECRTGVTSMEAEYGPNGQAGGPISQLAVLPNGQNLERNGLRCSAYNGGVACGNVSAGVGFFVAKDKYELLSAPPAEPTAVPDATGTAPKTP
ncbi:hypothetical protein V1638_10490 [Pseudarthrobacter sp. J64]|uniref:hypothetical protein n=1 Tax=Pseudarthrobacter sp. J64 TaxID=3116485 RepID=UPI002E819F74|nr:hypothetical protein [Pseudarthrobacter sp. J64]MEE2569821.1 hypothetical protein [Pseudarthrobacter sp. J64]